MELFWETCVCYEFFTQFSKQCSGKVTSSYKVVIPHVLYHYIAEKLLIFDGLKWQDQQMHVDFNKSKTIVQSNKKTQGTDWLIDVLFNNDKQYIHNDVFNGTEYTHYNDKFYWSKKAKNTLTFSGKLMHRNHGSQWQKIA